VENWPPTESHGLNQNHQTRQPPYAAAHWAKEHPPEA
jgi:hypothetical protein